MANVLFVLLETCTVNTGLKQHNFDFQLMPLFKTIAQIRLKTRELFNTEKIPILSDCLFVCFVVLRPR